MKKYFVLGKNTFGLMNEGKQPKTQRTKAFIHVLVE